MDDDTPQPVDTATAVLDVYWRPGCGFCSAMRTALNEAGIDAEWHNIWVDSHDAEFVRSAADGNETVPTVRIGSEVLVAPKPRDVVAKVATMNPNLVVNQQRWTPLRIAQWVTITTMIVLSFTVSRAGHETLSWLIDGGALLTFLGFRSLRSRPRTTASRHKAIATP